MTTIATVTLGKDGFYGELNESNGHVAYLTENLDKVLCLECGHKVGIGHYASMLFHINIYPYKQTCHRCGILIVKGRTDLWPDLFSKK
jgi:hypothetical protein